MQIRPYSVLDEIVALLDTVQTPTSKIKFHLNEVEAIIPNIPRDRWENVLAEEYPSDMDRINQHITTFSYDDDWLRPKPISPPAQDVQWVIQSVFTHIPSLANGLTQNNFIQCFSIQQLIDNVVIERKLPFQQSVVYGDLAFVNQVEGCPSMVMVQRDSVRGLSRLWDARAFTFGAVAMALLGVEDAKRIGRIEEHAN